MATELLDDVVADIASELGIPAAKLASMDSKKIKKLMESGDLDPSQKARLVRAHLEKAMESLDLVSGFVEDAEGEADSRSMKRGSKKGDEYGDDSF